MLCKEQDCPKIAWVFILDCLNVDKIAGTSPFFQRRIGLWAQLNKKSVFSTCAPGSSSAVTWSSQTIPIFITLALQIEEDTNLLCLDSLMSFINKVALMPDLLGERELRGQVFSTVIYTQITYSALLLGPVCLSWWWKNQVCSCLISWWCWP